MFISKMELAPILGSLEIDFSSVQLLNKTSKSLPGCNKIHFVGLFMWDCDV